MRRAAEALSRGLAVAATFAPAAAALATILCAGFLAERLARAQAQADLRETVRIEAESVRARLDGALSAHLRNLAVLESDAAGGIGSERLARRLEGLLAQDPLASALALRGPDGAVLVHPPGDGAAAALRAALAQPASPGTRIVADQGPPMILVWSGDGGARAAAALDLGALDRLAGAPVRDPPPDTALDTALDIALVAGEPGARALLLGDPAVLARGPVALRLAMPAADWRLAAAPRGGWTPPVRGVWTIRLATLLAAALVVGPMLRTRSLVAERRRHIADLDDREVQLARLSRRHGLALDASRVGVWDYDIDSDTLVWDDRMDELYGLPRDGRPRVYADWRGALHPEDLARAEAEFRRAIERTGRYVSDFRLILDGGAIRHIRAIGAVYSDPDGAMRIVGVNWDVTPDVARSAELEARRLEAEAASVAKSQFLATMSHEIRTPMNGVLGMLELLLRSGLCPEQRRRAEIARDSAGHLLAILNDTLDFSRLEAGRAALELAPADPAAIVRGVAALLSAAAAERGLALAVHVAPCTPEWLVCDAARLRQVVLNLVGNAIKFTDAGRIDVTVGYVAAAAGGALEVTVRDTGIGISPDDRDRLFQRFVQVDSSITRRRDGAGLGLAISRQLVELMGGAIGLESAPGAGSTFSFRIPLEACAAGAPARSDPPAPPEASPPLRVLLVEDNPTNQHILAAFLRLAGHSLRLAENGARALEAVAAEHFDLVLMDIQMPEMDGMTAARRIRGLPGPAGAVPIIALTANAMQGDREQYLAAGMDDYVSKPVSAPELHAAIARALRGPAARCA